MAISKVKIGNMALSLVGTKSTIEAFPPTETTVEANTLDLWYDIVREEVLEAYDWTFARKRISLAAHGDAAPDEWAYRYQYPSDAVKLRKMVHPSDSQADAVPYEIMESTDGTMCILTNLEDADMFYTYDLTDVTRFRGSFVSAFAHLLGSRVTRPLKGKKSTADDLFNQAVAIIRQAAGANHNEEVSPPPRDADWTRARTGGTQVPDATIDRTG